jgi:hypothetical protein
LSLQQIRVFLQATSDHAVSARGARSNPIYTGDIGSATVTDFVKGFRVSRLWIDFALWVTRKWGGHGRLMRTCAVIPGFTTGFGLVNVTVA